MESQFIYIIGPGGAGKSTAGQLAADIMGWIAIDLDEEFCHLIMNIRKFIIKYGYEEYVARNSALLRHLMMRRKGQNTLFILSSGFLSTDVCHEIVEENKEIIMKSGLSVLIMPSPNYDLSLKCIIERQLSRGLGLSVETETRKFHHRFYEYIKMGDVRIFSMEKPDSIACLIASKVNMHFQNRGK